VRSILLAMMVGLLGCAPKPVPVATPDPVPQPQTEAVTTLVVTEAEAGPVALAVGQDLIVRLESNPSTGYSWTVAPSDAPVLAPREVQHMPDEVPAGVVGAGGIDALRFSAVAAGTQTLTFRYARSWETDTPPAKEVVFTVTVQ